MNSASNGSKRFFGNSKNVYVDPKYKNIVYSSGSSPEDIAAWIKERKARFPTRERVKCRKT